MGLLWLIPFLLAAYLLYAILGCILPFTHDTSLGRETRAKLHSVDFISKSNTPCGDWAHIAESGPESYARRIELVRAAQLTLDMTVYTIKPGVTGEQFFAEVLRAADRGVRVRILLGGKTHKLRRHRTVYKALRSHPRVQMQVFNPFNPLTPWRWNVMMHDKFIIADGKALTLGGRNFGDEYCDPPDYCGRITHDREVFLLGQRPSSAVRQVLEYYEELWLHPATVPIKSVPNKGEKDKEELFAKAVEFEEKHPDYCRVALPLGQMVVPTSRVTLVHNPITLQKKQPWVGWQMFRLANMGKNVWLQTPYMTNTPQVMECISEMAERAEINVLTNSCKSSPNLPAYSVYLANRKKFLATGAKLYEYAADDVSSIHAKALLVDDRLCAIGSFNLDDRSMFIDTETMLVFDSPQLAAQLKTRIDALVAESAVVQPDNTYAEEDKDKLPSGAKKALFLAASCIFRPLRFLV